MIKITNDNIFVIKRDLGLILIHLIVINVNTKVQQCRNPKKWKAICFEQIDIHNIAGEVQINCHEVRFTIFV